MAGAVRRLVVVVRVAMRVGGVVGMGVNHARLVPPHLFQGLVRRGSGPHEGPGHQRGDDCSHAIDCNLGPAAAQVRVWRGPSICV